MASRVEWLEDCLREIAEHTRGCADCDEMVLLAHAALDHDDGGPVQKCSHCGAEVEGAPLRPSEHFTGCAFYDPEVRDRG